MTNLSEAFDVASQGSSIRCVRESPVSGESNRDYVLLCHGLTNNHMDAPLFDVLRAKTLAADLDLFMFDFAGSGESDGVFHDKTWSQMRANLSDVIAAIDSRFPTQGRMALVGRSVGASIAGFFVKDPRVACAALASPVLFVTAQFGPLRTHTVGGYVPLPASLERSGQIKGEWELGEQFFDELASTEAGLIDAVTGASRVLVMHGEKDPKVGIDNAMTLFDLLGEPRRYVGIADGDHYYHGCEAASAQVILSWVTQQLERN